ncbi:ABC transporter substrate-binding protein [Lacticaseibacillus daqingensis]|uniref:ABC transporter substrate-binding protein n=1 Tax=Lacticaseibacillus daqingensis TaxID=2486014 RepID=UPI000F79AB6E|nr:ABC transporter substrate-binding protein [Lacticaseibacillus daqingensis]
MKVKHIVQTASVLLASTLLLGACGQKKASSTKDGDDEKVTIRFSWWGADDRHKATNAAVKQFEKENPNIAVKTEYAGWDGQVEKMATQMAGGTESDLMQITYDWYQTYNADGTGFADLNAYKDIVDLSGYSQSMLAEGTTKDKLLAIPYSNSTHAYGVNQTVYAKYGVDVSKLKTWNDYKDAAKKFPEGSYPLMITSFNEITDYLGQKYGKSFIDASGKVSFTASQVAEGLKWWQSMVDAKVTPSMKEVMENVGTADGSSVKEVVNGQYAGFAAWSGNMAAFNQVLKDGGMKMTIPSMPRIKADGRAGSMQKPTMLFAISKDTKHAKAAAKLLNFLLNDPKGVKTLGVTRGLPANTNAAKILEKNGQVDDVTKMAAEYQQTTKGINQSPYYEMSQVLEAYDAPMKAYGLGQLSADEAGKKIVTDVKDAIKQIKNQ